MLFYIQCGSEALPKDFDKQKGPHRFSTLDSRTTLFMVNNVGHTVYEETNTNKSMDYIVGAPIFQPTTHNIRDPCCM